MRIRAGVVVVLVALAGIGLILTTRLAGEAQLGASTADIDPRVLEALERQAEVDVDIALKSPTIPFEQQTTAYMRQYAADIQARVLSSVTPADFTLIYQFPLSPSLSGRITASGLTKLASHPDVVAIEMPVLGTVDVSAAD